MKKIILFCCCIFTMQMLRAQSAESDYRSKVQKVISDVNLENKILFINVWESNDMESRQNNKEFIRVSNIYKGAKLKNGLKGVCYVNISLDKMITIWKIALQKDSIVGDYCLENSSSQYSEILKDFNYKTGNIVINSKGEIIATNLSKESCFKFFNKLITR